MRINYTLFSDDDYEWLSVTVKELARLGIADKITDGSRIKGGTSYLLGGDLELFLEQKKARGEEVVQYKSASCVNSSSLVRGFDRYNYKMKGIIDEG